MYLKDQQINQMLQINLERAFFNLNSVIIVI